MCDTNLEVYCVRYTFEGKFGNPEQGVKLFRTKEDAQKFAIQYVIDQSKEYGEKYMKSRQITNNDIEYAANCLKTNDELEEVVDLICNPEECDIDCKKI
jgi:hypothetical protein